MLQAKTAKIQELVDGGATIDEKQKVSSVHTLLCSNACLHLG